MLAVDVEQVIGHLAQLGHGGRAAVDPGPAAALCIHGPAQQQGGLVSGQAGRVQPGSQCGGEVELGTDLGPRRALAHHAGIAPAAQGQLQRIDQNGLAGAGLAGEHREAGVEIELKRRHDDKVPQGQAAQHG